MHDERAETRLRRAVDRVVRCVADPALAVPGDADARRIPGAALRVRRAAVIQDAPVGRPAHGPLRVSSEAAGIGVRSPLREVARVGVHADVEPVAGQRRAIGPRIGEPRELLAGAQRHRAARIAHVLERPAVDLLADFVERGARRVRVPPVQVADRLGKRSAFVLVELADLQEDARDDFLIGLARLPVDRPPSTSIGSTAPN